MTQDVEPRLVGAGPEEPVGSPGAAGATNRYHTSTIKTIYALENGSAILSFDAESTYCTNSASPKYYVISVGQSGVTADGLKQMYATALMAYSTEKPITILFDDATTSCYVRQIILGG